jgi:prevent-host-death family protein
VKTVSAAKVAAQFDKYLEASREQPLLVTRNGKPVAVLLAVQNKADAEQAARRHTRSLRSILQQAHEQIEQGGGIPHDQFWREVAELRRKKPAATPRGKTK